MKTIQVELGKPSKFYVNNKRVCLNTAFGMYIKGVKFTINGKKLKLNENSFGIHKRKKKKKKRRKKRVKSVSPQSVSAAYRIPSDLVQKIILMSQGLNPHPTARIIQDNIRKQREIENARLSLYLPNLDSWTQTMRWSSDNEDWYAPSHSGEVGRDRGEVMELPSSDRDRIMDILRQKPASYWHEPSF